MNLALIYFHERNYKNKLKYIYNLIVYYYNVFNFFVISRLELNINGYVRYLIKISN